MFWLGLSLGYGLEFFLGLFWLLFLGVLSLERGVSTCLSIKPSFCFRNHSLSRLRCSGVASSYGWVTILLYCLWLNEHTYYFLTINSMVKDSTFLDPSLVPKVQQSSHTILQRCRGQINRQKSTSA